MLVDVLYILITFAIDVFWLKRLLSTFGVKFMYTGAVFFQSKNFFFILTDRSPAGMNF